MSVIYDSSTGQYSLHTENYSYIMLEKEGFLLHLYWGEKTFGDCTYMFREQGRAAFSPRMENCDGFILDDVPLEYPCWGRADMRTPALEITNPDGSVIVDLRVKNRRIEKGKPSIKGLPAIYVENEDECETLVVSMYDEVSNISVELYYCVLEKYDIITRFARIVNKGNDTVYINRAASCALDFDHINFDVISNYGTHCRERQIERASLKHGRFIMSSRRGASSHVHNPFMILTSPNADEVSGDAYGFVLVYSGSFSSEIAANQFDSARAVIGLNPENFTWRLDSGEEFTTPECVLSYSSEGLDTLSYNFSRVFRERLCRGKYRDIRRPVLLNSWEACYFSFDSDRLMKIGDSCAELGIELMVIDDGWFGKRDHDRCSLGDWFVNEQKLKGGIKRISDYLNEKGVKLGIWFEPEMISPDSELYQKHPDWCLHYKNRPRSEGRYQLILDLTRQDVCDYVFESVANILREGGISYVKWDFNRNMSEAGSILLDATRGREVDFRYYLGLYSVLERLNQEFPDVLFESCSGGGGRFDVGMLYYMPQVWTSDNSDAIERLRIQYGTSLVYPMSAMSAHVSASPNHQTGHVTSFYTRSNVALTGSFGYELDPTSLSVEEQKMVSETTRLFKEYGEILAKGRYHRLRDPHNEPCSAWCTVSEDKSVCIATYVLTHVRMYGNNERIKLRGLDHDAIYKERFSGVCYRGDQLMNFGLHAPISHEFGSILWILEKVEQ
ncbi:MAG: alpha-galactosidase [Clostridia bacterium]|nr:alpha-galactosidase [Clostridia bacterium]